VLLSPRPGRIVEELDVDLPRPRPRDDRAVVELRERALGVLGADRAGPHAREPGPRNGALREADEVGSADSADGAARRPGP
jgi:hypothetical protein